MKVLVRMLAICLLLAVVGSAAQAATAAKPQSFWVRGTVVSVKENSIVIKVASSPKPITRYEQKGELTVVLAPKAAIRMGSKAITAAMLKPNEWVMITGTYTPGDKPTFKATRVTVSAK